MPPNSPDTTPAQTAAPPAAPSRPVGAVLQTAPSPPPLEGFDFIRPLGSGGQATVWEARQHDPDRDVAVKVLDADISQNPRDIEAFYAEAKTAAALDHPNIVTVFEVGCQNNTYYYVMELAAGYDTGKWLARKGRLAEADVLTIAESVAIALDYASRSIGIIHCDIKPANIMVDGDGTVRLTDMGVARFRRSTDAEYITGTPAYMSPEQTLGDAPLDERSDIYSLGATMFNLLTGHSLFQGLSDEKIMECQRSTPAPDLRQENPAVTPQCAALVARFLAKSPADRPQSWQEALALIRAASELPSPAPSGSDGQSSRPGSDGQAMPGQKGSGAAEALAAAPPGAHPAFAPPGARAPSFFWLLTALFAILAFAIAFAIARI